MIKTERSTAVNTRRKDTQGNVVVGESPKNAVYGLRRDHTQWKNRKLEIIASLLQYADITKFVPYIAVQTFCNKRFLVVVVVVVVAAAVAVFVFVFGLIL
jgi:hypothetical protein